MIISVTLSIHIVCDIFRNELLKVFTILKDVVHRLLSNEIMHLLIAVELKAHRTKQTIAILFHLLDDQALLGEQRVGERLIALLPLVVGEAMVVAKVFVATIVA